MIYRNYVIFLEGGRYPNRMQDPRYDPSDAAFVANPHPGTLDLSRDPNPHLGFGAGIHFCLGAPLARIELEESLAALLRLGPDRRPRLRGGEPPWKPGYVIRGLRTLRLDLS
jgi:cytochrome P450